MAPLDHLSTYTSYSFIFFPSFTEHDHLLPLRARGWVLGIGVGEYEGRGVEGGLYYKEGGGAEGRGVAGAR